jgi:hypothetical protein
MKAEKELHEVGRRALSRFLYISSLELSKEERNGVLGYKTKALGNNKAQVKHTYDVSSEHVCIIDLIPASFVMETEPEIKFTTFKPLSIASVTR